MTWAQNERGYRPNLWKRISIHIKKKEENNQTAIIKPFSKGCEAPLDTGVKGSYERPQSAQRYPVTYRPRTPSPLPTVCQRGSMQHCCKDEEAVRERTREESSRERQPPVVALPTYLTERSQRGGPQQSSIMDQITSVVNRFTANISELNSMMLPPSSPPGTSINVSGPGSPTFRLLQRDVPQLSTTVTTYAEVVAAANATPRSAVGITGGIITGGSSQTSPARLSYCTYDPLSAVRTTELEELAALTPPSPFRDSSVGSASDSPASPDSELALCQPCSPKYDRLMLRNYSQSSSSL